MKFWFTLPLKTKQNRTQLAEVLAEGGNVKQVAIDININYSLTSYRNEDKA